MLAESLTDTRINIKNLILECPQDPPRLPFDPKKDLNIDDLETIRDFFDNELILPLDYSSHASNALLIDPEFSSFPFRDQERDYYWEIGKDDLEVCRGKQDKWYRFFTVAVELKILFPERVSELNLDETSWQAAIAELNDHVHGKDYAFSLTGMTLKRMAILYPSRIKELDRGQIWGEILTNLAPAKRSRKDEGFILFATATKLFFPEHLPELDLENAWDDMKEVLGVMRARPKYNRYGWSKWGEFLETIANLTILSARKIILTEDRFQPLLHPLEFSAQRLSLPVIRRF